MCDQRKSLGKNEEGQKSLRNRIKRRKLEYLRDIMRNDKEYKILKSILQVFGKNLRTWFSNIELLRAADNKVVITRVLYILNK